MMKLFPSIYSFMLVVILTPLLMFNTAEVDGSIPEIRQPIVEFLKAKEGYRGTAYRDAVGVLTIGYGHTGKDVYPGLKITKDEGEQLLRRDAKRFENYVWEKVDRMLNWHEFGSVVSFCYNLGYRLKGGLLHGIETANNAKVVYKMNLYIYAGGRVLRGLVIRRKEESLFYIGDEGIIKKYTPENSDKISENTRPVLTRPAINYNCVLV